MVPLPLPDHPGSVSGNQVFANADSFAQAFDEAWFAQERRHGHHGLDSEQKLAMVLEALAEHPFRQQEPQLAEQVGRFRLRLLGLE